MTDLDRFFAKVSPEPNSGCWLWTGALNKDGYGHFKIGRVTDKAHRFAARTFICAPPPGKEVDHLCRVRCCVNPDHLRYVTHQENCSRSIISPTHRNTKKTHCKWGHALDAANVRIEVYGGVTMRKCRRCCSRRVQQSKARKALALIAA